MAALAMMGLSRIPRSDKEPPQLWERPHVVDKGEEHLLPDVAHHRARLHPFCLGGLSAHTRDCLLHSRVQMPFTIARSGRDARQ